jgi:hypothetical protein
MRKYNNGVPVAKTAGWVKEMKSMGIYPNQEKAKTESDFNSGVISVPANRWTNETENLNVFGATEYIPGQIQKVHYTYTDLSEVESFSSGSIDDVYTEIFPQEGITALLTLVDTLTTKRNALIFKMRYGFYNGIEMDNYTISEELYELRPTKKSDDEGSYTLTPESISQIVNNVLRMIRKIANRKRTGFNFDFAFPNTPNASPKAPKVEMCDKCVVGFDRVVIPINFK